MPVILIGEGVVEVGERCGRGQMQYIFLEMSTKF